MKLRKKFELGVLLLYCKLFKKRRPLFISWYLTNRCNMHCKYCNSQKIRTKELNTERILEIIDEIYEMGCRCINFSGGEPLLRRDIGSIVDYCKDKGIYVGIDSNGLLVKDKINEISKADLLQVTLDLPKSVHESQRGKKSYDKIIEAIHIAKVNKIKTAISVTLTKYNARCIAKIIKFIKKEKILATFQPVAPILFGNKKFKRLNIPKRQYSKVIEYITHAKEYCRHIVNTTGGLRYLKDENKREINCGAFKINCVIAPNGDLYPCNRLYNKTKPFNCAKVGFKNAFLKSEPINCDSCLCSSTLDLALAYEKLLSLDIGAVRDLINSGLK